MKDSGDEFAELREETASWPLLSAKSDRKIIDN
jgi:hypothetical protein